MKSAKWKLFRPFYVYPALAALLLYFTLKHNIYSPGAVALLLLLGLAEWMLLEYVLHRFAFHVDVRSPMLRSFLQTNHMKHHADTSDPNYIFVPIGFGISVSALSIVLRTLLIWPWQGAIIVTVGIWIGYLWYEFVHYTAHMRRPRNRLLRYLKIYHLKHHFRDSKTRFGVTSPITDGLFGTYRPIADSERANLRSGI